MHFITIARPKDRDKDEFLEDERLYRFLTYSSHHHIGKMEKQFFITEPHQGDTRLIVYGEFKKEVTDFIQTEQQYNAISNCLKQINVSDWSRKNILPPIAF